MEIQQLKKITKLLKTIKEKGECWAASALVHNSCGYYTPKQALKIIKEFVETKTLCGGAERTLCCFKGNPYEEMEFDFMCFQRIDNDRANGIIQRITAFAEMMKNDNQLAEMTFSCLAPTMF